MIKFEVTTPLTTEDILILQAIGNIEELQPSDGKSIEDIVDNFTTKRKDNLRQAQADTVRAHRNHMTEEKPLPTHMKITSTDAKYLQILFDHGEPITTLDFAKLAECSDTTITNNMHRAVQYKLVRKGKADGGFVGRAPHTYKLTKFGLRSLQHYNREAGRK